MGRLVVPLVAFTKQEKLQERPERLGKMSSIESEWTPEDVKSRGKLSGLGASRSKV